MSWEDYFADLEYYPGSRKKRPVNPKTLTEQGEDRFKEELGTPKIYNIEGKPTEFFTIGQLAHALNRSAVTLRKWESDGIIPVAKYVAPSETPNGKRRLYTLQQVEGMVRIAREEGILEETWKPIKNTRFTQRVTELFKELS